MYFHNNIYSRFIYKLFFIFLFLSSFAYSQKNLKHLNVSLSLDERIETLISSTTLQEKISQMNYNAPAIERLGIPKYNWWNECLHGVARNGLATVFPQAIGIAAMWDKDLMFQIATAISDEARIKYYDGIKDGTRDIYQGLTFWTPNINIFRDPRWGRGMETYGEDPYLTGELAVQFIKGLQGDDPKYFKTIATAKHFAVHSGPEPDRHTFNAEVSEYDLRETYLPAFKVSVQKANVQSLMCAYNSFRGRACCSNDSLLNEILRNEWGFKGYVVSDCWAISDIYKYHNEAKDATEASAFSVLAGTDLECGDSYSNLSDAVQSRMISENDLNKSLRRLFYAQFKLGMYDPPELVKYSKIDPKLLDCDRHKALALEATRNSIVLLKNENNLLPLNKMPKTIAVIGPNADDPEVLLANYNGVPSNSVTPLKGIINKVGNVISVIYEKGCSIAEHIPLKENEILNKNEEVDAINAAKLSDIIILVMGLSPRLEGEEMDVPVEGFYKGDRLTLDLPKIQQNLIRKIVAIGKPTVLVLLNGSAVSINWENDKIPAIIESWYGGQAAGTAIAEVLFGEINPSGKLPVTFYKSVDQLPNFKDYSMRSSLNSFGRTYRYFTGDVLYPFGYGLSYTSFEYSNLRLNKNRISGSGEANVSIDIKNSGKMKGSEVVQLYTKGTFENGAIKSLKGFLKINLNAGETKTVDFLINKETLQEYSNEKGFIVYNGEHILLVGSSSAEKDLKEIKLIIE
ncbi:MAG: glycoside hydrolase family 3 C-terminal domain-containing protein [Melioribacteraceae bacterium]